MKIKRALISVSDKRGLEELARGLNELGVELISTGGTAERISKAGIPVKEVSDITKFPEMLGGRVKSLHPAIFGGILAERTENHLAQLQEQNIEPIDLVVCNLYPFAKVISSVDATEDQAIENIDIGGPSMIRAAAKNFKYVAVVVEPNDYGAVLEELRETKGELSPKTRKQLAIKAFQHTADYDGLIYRYLSDYSADNELFPEFYDYRLKKVMDLRYGENPHQKAALYQDLKINEPSLVQAEQLNGKALSYNNINDTNAALELLNEFFEPTVVAVKHTNPCGVASHDDIAQAYQLAYEADPVSIFGGIVACNRTVTKEMAEKLSKIFLEVVVAPDYQEEALAILKKKANLRILKLPGLSPDARKPAITMQKIVGGVLIQERDLGSLKNVEPKQVTAGTLDESLKEDLEFAWKIVKHVKSNAIVVAKNKQTLGVGAGQMNRIDAAIKAIEAAGKEAEGAVLASDAFFPFDDVVKEVVKAGIKGVIQPGGSIRDEDSIAVLNEAKTPMVFTGMRHFRH